MSEQLRKILDNPPRTKKEKCAKCAGTGTMSGNTRWVTCDVCSGKGHCKTGIDYETWIADLKSQLSQQSTKKTERVVWVTRDKSKSDVCEVWDTKPKLDISSGFFNRDYEKPDPNSPVMTESYFVFTKKFDVSIKRGDCKQFLLILTEIEGNGNG